MTHNPSDPKFFDRTLYRQPFFPLGLALFAVFFIFYNIQPESQSFSQITANVKQNLFKDRETHWHQSVHSFSRFKWDKHKKYESSSIEDEGLEDLSIQRLDESEDSTTIENQIEEETSEAAESNTIISTEPSIDYSNKVISETVPDNIVLNTTTASVEKIQITDSTQSSSNISSVPNNNILNPNLPYILFYKTHKTGSSSVQNVLMRLALKYKSPILWAKGDGTGIGYPRKFTFDMVRNAPHSVKMHCNHVNPSEKLIEMFPEQKDMKKDNKKLFQFTIMREPLGLMKSAYNYFESTGASPCLGKSGTLKNYLDNFSKFSAIKSYHPFCKNAVAFDLGYRNDVTDLKSIKNIINELDQKLDLVLILEYYWESMILMKEALGLTLEDVVSFKLNRAVSRPSKINISEEEEPKYRKLVQEYIKVDSMLYDHFKLKFEKKMDALGLDYINHQVEQLKDITNKKFNQCGVYEVIPASQYGGFLPSQNLPANKIPWHPPNVKITSLLLNMKKEDDEELYEDCLKRTLPELKMGKFTRESQYADGLIIEPKRYGVAGFKGRKRRAQNEKKILTKQEIMYDLYEKGLYTPEIWPVDLDIPTG